MGHAQIQAPYLHAKKQADDVALLPAAFAGSALDVDIVERLVSAARLA